MCMCHKLYERESLVARSVFKTDSGWMILSVAGSIPVLSAIVLSALLFTLLSASYQYSYATRMALTSALMTLLLVLLWHSYEYY